MVGRPAKSCWLKRPERAQAGGAAAQSSGHEQWHLVAKRFGLMRSRAAPRGEAPVLRGARTQHVVRQTVRGCLVPGVWRAGSGHARGKPGVRTGKTSELSDVREQAL